MGAAIDSFIAKTKQGPDYVCSSCRRLKYRQCVVPLNRKKYVKASQTVLGKVLSGDCNSDGTYWI